MKIPLGGGQYLEPDDNPRDTRFHKKIIQATPVPNYPARNFLHLECGHRVISFGDLAHAGGVILCDQCRDQEGDR